MENSSPLGSKTTTVSPSLPDLVDSSTAPHPFLVPSAAVRSNISEIQPALQKIAIQRTFWNQYSTVINFWLDALLTVLFVVQAWMFAVLHVVFPRGAGSEWTIWKATRLDWSEALLVTFCVFATAVVVHVMFHWEWVCGVVATRFLKTKARRDDGSHTLIGVGFLVLLVHLILIGALIARVGLTRAT